MDTPAPPGFLEGIAMTLAELSRLNGADLARRLADQWELSLPDFAAARVDASDREELRRVFASDGTAADMSGLQPSNCD